MKQNCRQTWQYDENRRNARFTTKRKELIKQMQLDEVEKSSNFIQNKTPHDTLKAQQKCGKVISLESLRSILFRL